MGLRQAFAQTKNSRKAKEKMKIAVVTLPLHTNYGGILQAYALQQILARAGHDAYLARFGEGAAYKIYHPVSVYIKQRGLIPYRHDYPLSAREHASIRRNTNAFIAKHIRQTQPLSGKGMASLGFDAFIVGSDQVWRHYDPRYFLGFLPESSTVRRISYAASFGIDRWPFTEGQTEEIKKLAARFDAVSVREDSGVEMCADRLGLKADLVLDPTLLLEKEDYTSLTGEEQGAPDAPGSIMTYMLDKSPGKEEIITKAAALSGFGVNSVTPAAKPGKGVDVERCVWPPVEEWITGFANAGFVVTDSFHGTALSILFNKPFITVCNDGRGAARFHSLLGMFGLERRLVKDGEMPDEKLFGESIDFAKVNELLKERRRESLDFINRALRQRQE